MKRLSGKTIAVTGASSGIGRAAALGFAAEGARVALLDRSTALLEELARDVGSGALALETDVTDEASVAQSFRRLRGAAGPLDVLFNCAGVQMHDADRPVHELKIDAWSTTLATNLTGVYLCCKYAIQSMLKSGDGSIINCGSPTAIRGSGVGYHAYTAAKGGVHALSQVMAVEYAPAGVRVNLLVPGATETPLTKQLLDDPSRRAAMLSRIPTGRLGVPADYVALAVLLASDELTYATGAVFVADGGRTII